MIKAMKTTALDNKRSKKSKMEASNNRLNYKILK